MARRGDPGQNPTLRGRRLAMELQRRREATGMSREEVARQLEWSTSTLFRIETGRSRPQPGNVRTLLELYGVTGAERAFHGHLDAQGARLWPVGHLAAKPLDGFFLAIMLRPLAKPLDGFFLAIMLRPLADKLTHFLIGIDDDEIGRAKFGPHRTDGNQDEQ